MQIYKNPPYAQYAGLLKRPVFDNSVLQSNVSNILNDVKANGDLAVTKYTKHFDNVDVKLFKVDEKEIINSAKYISTQLRNAIDTASKNIYKFHFEQKDEIRYIQTVSGVECWRKSVAIEKVGLYIPGGTAPLFSSVLMLAIPAKIAGCSEIVLCTPPNKEGKVHPTILFAAKVAGVTDIYAIGGVQAIGAMAYGTETVPKVYKIFGPGNQYVTTAKQIVALQDTAIDMPAGPSEVLVLADKTADAEFIASDLLSQAEHGVDSQVIFVTTYEPLIEQVEKEIENQLPKLPRKDIAKEALKHSRAFYLDDKQDVVKLVNEYAPEHLIISVENEGYYLDRLKNAGSVFLGKYTPESAGDYASGTNHTLPTNGFAKMYSGVSLDSFLKKITYQRITANALLNIGPVITQMAAAEELHGHENAVSIRMEKIKAERYDDND